MKNFAAPITLALACIAYGLVVGCAFYFAAQAQGATNVCNPDCLMQKMDALNQENHALERTVGELALQINKSIRIGQAVTLHTQGGHGRDAFLTSVPVEIRAALFRGTSGVPAALCGLSISTGLPTISLVRRRFHDLAKFGPVISKVECIGRLIGYWPHA